MSSNTGKEQINDSLSKLSSFYKVTTVPTQDLINGQILDKNWLNIPTQTINGIVTNLGCELTGDGYAVLADPRFFVDHKDSSQQKHLCGTNKNPLWVGRSIGILLKNNHVLIIEALEITNEYGHIHSSQESYQNFILNIEKTLLYHPPLHYMGFPSNYISPSIHENH